MYGVEEMWDRARPMVLVRNAGCSPACASIKTERSLSNRLLARPVGYCPAFEDGPQQIRFLVIDGLARSRNKLEKQRTSTKNKNNNNEHKQEGITTHPNHNNNLENKEHNQEQGKHNFEKNIGQTQIQPY